MSYDRKRKCLEVQGKKFQFQAVSSQLNAVFICFASIGSSKFVCKDQLFSLISLSRSCKYSSELIGSG